MLAYVLLPLIGLGLLATVFDDSIDDLTSASTDPDTPEGTDGADELIGTGGDDLLSGLEGPDVLRGYGGDDTLLGGSGDDLAVGGDGDDSLQGDIGDDTLWGRDGDDRLTGSFGDDTLRGDNGDDTLSGGDGDDALLGGPGDDALIGNQGDDLIETGLGEDTVFGGDGDDRITGFHLPLTEGAEPGADDEGADQLNGGDGNDTITGNAGDQISGGGGADLIRSFGVDQEGGGGVTVTDFDPAEDSLLLAVSSGSELSLDADDADLEITQASNGIDTNVVVNGVLVAVLQDTDAAALAADTSWLVNVTDAPDSDPLVGTGAGDAAGGIEPSDTPSDIMSDIETDGPEGAEIESDATPDTGALAEDTDDDAPVELAMDEDLDSGAEDEVTSVDPDLLLVDLEDETQLGGTEDDIVEADDVAEDRAANASPEEAFDAEFDGIPSDLISSDEEADLADTTDLDQSERRIDLVTGFDPAEDTFVLTDNAGEDVIIEDAENLLIRAAANGEDTEIVYGGAVVAVLQETDAADLASDQSWIGNAFGTPDVMTPPLDVLAAA